jgi:N-dimethylarginine dimethylaminohydrolase
MCRPTHFTVSYRINPWMHPEAPTDTSKALAQWQRLHDVYAELGFEISVIDGLAGLPDMVYAANGGFVLDGIAYGPKFRYPERAAEAAAYLDWFAAEGLTVVEPTATNEGEGDLLLVGDVILAGNGFRTSPAAHAEVARVYGREVVPLTLVDPNFYHLDTALAVLDPEPGDGGAGAIAYLEAAFDAASLARLRERFPDAIIVSDADAAVLGLNAFSDGRNVVLSSRATGFAAQLRERGYNPIGVDLSELLLGGGGVKCCTLDLHRTGAREPR